MHTPWTRDEEIIVFSLYCQIPFKNSSKNHPDVVRVAALIGRSPSAVNMKIGNFGSFDETLQRQGIVGLTNASKLDKQIWDEFHGQWDILSYESERLIQERLIQEGMVVDEGERICPIGMEKSAMKKERINQNFFRKAVLNSYDSMCCITGLAVPQLLIASHIKPWRDSSPQEKTDPYNGLCLNALHDKAFDVGLITVTTDHKIRVSSFIKEHYERSIVESLFKVYDGQKIVLPEKFSPNRYYLEYHNDVVFLQ